MSNPPAETPEQSEQRYKELADSFPQTVAETDEKGDLAFVNANGFEVFGYTKDDFDKGLNVLQMIIPADHARAKENMQKLFSGEKIGGNEYTAIRKDGTMFPVTIYSNPVLSGNKPLGMRAIIIDATERVRAETALRNSEERYRQLVDSINKGVFVAQDGMLKLVNPMLMEITGYSKRDLTTLPITEFIHPDDRNVVLERHSRQMKGEEFPTRYKFRILTSNGSTRWLELDSVMIQWEDKPAVLAFVGDITERKQTERALKESEEKFAKSFLKSPIPMAITAMKDGRYVEVNEAFAKVMGLKREELMDNTSIGAGYITAEQRAIFLDEYRQKGSVENLELLMRVKGGELRYGLFNSSKITIGEEDFFLTQVTDITELKRTQEALRESEERYRSIYENAIEGMYQASPEGRYISVNPALARMHGFESPHEMVTNVTDIGSQIFMSPEARQQYKEILEKEGTVVNFEFELYCKDRSTVWVSTSARAIRNKNGETLYYEGKVEDITKRKKAEEALLESEKRYRMLADSATDVIFIFGFDMKYKYISPSVKKIRGFSPEELVGQPISHYIKAESLESMRNVIKQELEVDQTGTADPNRARVMEMEMLCKDGSTMWTEVKASALRNDNGEPIEVMGIARDITERKQTQDEREKLIRELQEAVNKIKTLSGLLPICASCKKIQNHKGQWEPMEVYIRDHSEAEFSHGICPECAEKVYPEYVKKK